MVMKKYTNRQHANKRHAGTPEMTSTKVITHKYDYDNAKLTAGQAFNSRDVEQAHPVAANEKTNVVYN
jgi:hypothetical protein